MHRTILWAAITSKRRNKRISRMDRRNKEQSQRNRNTDATQARNKTNRHKRTKHCNKETQKEKNTGPDNIPNEAFIEADQETRTIYQANFNKITKTEAIPQEWQEGEIITMYKGKGIKGKCSNERGITLSSNFGKLYERIINERAKNDI